MITKRQLILAVVLVIALVTFIRFGFFSGKAKAAENQSVFCSSYWYALVLRADGKNRTEAATAVRNAVPALYEYKRHDIAIPDGSIVWQISGNSVESVYYSYTLEKVKEIVNSRPEMRRACAEVLASNNK